MASEGDDNMKTTKTTKRFMDNIDHVLTYLKDSTYPAGFSRTQKKELRRKTQNFCIREGVFYYKHRGNEVRVITEGNEQQRIVTACHSGLGESKESKVLAGHFGRDKTQKKITERFYWPGICQDVKQFIDSCDTCQRVNRRFQKTPTQLQNIPITASPWRQFGIDLVGPLPETPEGYKYIVTAIDYYTKWPEAAPLKDKTAVSVAKFIYSVICRHGCPEIEISDQGREFVNEVNSQLHNSEPHANGLVERQNQTTQNILLKHLEGAQDQWSELLDGVLFACRTSVHSSTGYSPFYLLYNRNPRLPIDAEIQQKDETDSTKKDETDSTKKDETDSTSGSEPMEVNIDAMVEKMKKLRDVAAGKALQNIRKSQIQQKRNYDKRHEPSALKPGDKVLLRNMKNVNRAGGKLEERWIGPYTIEEVVKKGVFRLRNDKGKLLTPSYNAARLKVYKQPSVEVSRKDQESEEECTVTAVTSGTGPSGKLSSSNISEKDMRDLLTGEWLNDDIINAAQVLIQNKSPLVGGLLHTGIGKCNQIPIQCSEFVQILNSNDNHWVTVSTVGCGPGEISVYDSLYRTISTDVKDAIADMLHTDESMLTMKMPEMVMQGNTTDCGVMAVAAAVEILGQRQMFNFDVKKARKHLASGLKKGYIMPFPLNTHYSILQEKIYKFKVVCTCRKFITGMMAKCKQCRKKCHQGCLSLQTCSSCL